MADDLTLDPVEEAEATPEEKPSWTSLDQIALTAIVTIGGALRIARVGSPSGLMFDEVYYAKDACWYLLADPTTCEIDVEQPQVHPPLAKWVIALGIRIFGYDSLGWRIASVVAGTLTIALVYLLARKLLRSTLGASITSGLLAIDLLHFTQSRISMLDIFVPLFGVAAFLFVVYDRDRLLARFRSFPLEKADEGDPPEGEPPEIEPPEERPPNGIFDRPWRIWAGLAAAAAISCKWTGGLFLIGIILLTLVWEYAARRRDGGGRALWGVLVEEGPTIVLWFGLVPIAFYMATYIGRIHGDFFALPWSEGSWFGSWVDTQRYMLDFHRGLDATHSYQSPPWSWILLKRPVSYAYCGGSSCAPSIAEGSVMEVFAGGSPLVWWTSILAVLFATAAWLKRRSIEHPEGVILMGFFITYGPWLLPQFADRDAVFIFYLLPTVPFICLALGYVASRLAKSLEGRIAVAIYAAAALAVFVFYYPLVANYPIKQESWNKRIWIFNNCDKPPGVVTTTTVTNTVGGRTSISSSETVSDASLPPTGWCWI